MSCAECSARGWDHEALVDLYRESTYAVARDLCGYRDVSKGLHFALSLWRDSLVKQGKKRFLVMIPRGHFKTSLLTIAAIIREIICDPNVTILHMHASEDIAKKNLGAIQRILMSPLFRHFFPWIMKDTTTSTRAWNRHVLEVERTAIVPEPTVTALGVRSTIVGQHFTRQYFDDLVDRKAAFENPALMDQAIDFILNSDPLFVHPSKDIQYVIGTYWPGGFYESLIESGTYETALFGCYVDDRYREFLSSVDDRFKAHALELETGSPVFPERFDLEQLDGIRRRMGPIRFSHQYLNVPTSVEDDRFRPEHFVTYALSPDLRKAIIPAGSTGFGAQSDVAVHVHLESLFVTLTVDPALGQTGDHDESAITVCGYDFDRGIAFVLDAWAARVHVKGLIEKILEMAAKWRPVRIGIEKAGFQDSLRQWMEDEMKRRNLYFWVEGLSHGSVSKKVRIIDGLQPFIANKQVYFLESQNALKRELMNLRIVDGKIAGASPNLADSLAYHVQYWRSVGTAEESGLEDIQDDTGTNNPPPVKRRYFAECVN